VGVGVGEGVGGGVGGGVGEGVGEGDGEGDGEGEGGGDEGPAAAACRTCTAAPAMVTFAERAPAPLAATAIWTVAPP